MVTLVSRAAGARTSGGDALMDEQVISDAARNIGKLAIDMHRRNQGDDREKARAIADQVKRIQSQIRRNPEPGSGCKGCGNSVPEVKFGRPREYCESCHPPRYKVADKVAVAGMLQA
jgi:hypothetical protein